MAKGEKKYVTLYMDIETLEALDAYADMVGFSRSQAANSILAATVRDDVPAVTALVDMVKAYRAKTKGEKAQEPNAVLA